MKRKHKRPWGVFLAIALAIAFGSIVGDKAQIFGITFYAIVDTLGILFLNALTLVVVPLVSASIIVGVSRIGGEEGFKRLGAKMFTFYLGTSLLAILIGLFFVNLIGPGIGHVSPLAQDSNSLSQIKEHINGEGSQLVSVLLSIVPSNIIKALSKGEMLGLIFFSLIFGFCISKIEEHTTRNWVVIEISIP